MATKEEPSVDAVDLRNSVTTLVNHVDEPDQAYEYLKKLGISHDEVARVDLAKLRRKVDWHLLPILVLVYFMQFIDKVAVNFAAVMGMNRDIRLKGNEFSNVATALFAAYIVGQVPSAIALNKIPVGKLMGFTLAAWGIATACTAAVHDYHTLLVARIFLGFFESSAAPCLTLIVSQWYIKSEQGLRAGIWGSGLGAAQIVGGLVSYGFQNVHHSKLAGWRIMFLVLGTATTVLGLIVFVFIPDTPMSARFLSDLEKAAILHHTSVNQTGVRNKKFKASHLRELATDIQVWLLCLLVLLATIASGVITSYSSTLIRNFGFSPPHAALLNAPSGVVTIVALLVDGWGVRYFSHRWAWIGSSCLITVLGASLMSFLPKSNRAGLLAGIYLVNWVIPTMFLTYQWTASNVAGHTKRSIALSLIALSFGVANLIGPQTFQAKEAPGYRSAKITLVATQCAAAFTAFILFLYYKWENARRDAKVQDAASGLNIGQWENLTDKENPSFRYTY